MAISEGSGPTVILDDCEIRGIIAGHEVAPVFQPVVELGFGRPVGYEALARGPVGSRLHGAPQLFAAAAAAGAVAELDAVCFEASLRRFESAGLAAPLLVNVDPAFLT
ncbi:MAG TPA: EAL domain-containing protein, partial [Acidimicrobiales bacterium]|nr:EAL domain-containing protein [Acidimicrobiales bacterium]